MLLQVTHFNYYSFVSQELAKFHAVSLAAKFRDPIEFNKTKSTLLEWLITKENAYLSSGIDNGIQMASKVVENPDSSTVRKLKTILGRGYEVLSSLIVPSEPLAVVVHGDLWCNNLLFRYQPWTPSKTPRDVCFLDLQVSRYGSPSMDILYFLFTSSSSGVLNQHFHYLLSEYHKTLSDHLGMLAPQAPCVTLQDIKDDLRKHSMFGLLLTLLVLPAVSSETNKLHLDDMSEELLQDPSFIEQFEKDVLGPGYNMRVNEIFEFCDRENLI